MRVKKLLFSSALFLLFIPMFQNILNLFEIRNLDNMSNAGILPKYSVTNYLNVSYQDSFNLYAESCFGLKPLLIRINNQFNYELFRYTKAPGVVVGKEDCLFIESYIDNYTGKNFIGENKIIENVKKLKLFQDSLHKNGKSFLVVFAPGKATYHSDLIPDSYKLNASGKTNHKEYVKSLTESGVNFIDLNTYFLNIKSKLKYPLYTSFGTHWTSYGFSIAVDSICRYIEEKRDIQIPDLTYEVNFSDSLRHPDYDVGVLLNLFNELSHGPLPYLDFRIKETPGSVKPNALFVGDSYWWCVVGADIPAKLFAEDVYWNYNKDIYVRNVKQQAGVIDINVKQDIAKRDVVIIMATEATLALFPYGLPDSYLK